MPRFGFRAAARALGTVEVMHIMRVDAGILDPRASGAAYKLQGAEQSMHEPVVRLRPRPFSARVPRGVAC